jgi:hypothetical protein
MRSNKPMDIGEAYLRRNKLKVDSRTAAASLSSLNLDSAGGAGAGASGPGGHRLMTDSTNGIGGR